MNNIYYVYVLKYPDGKPFYVGKGKGNRWNEHEREARLKQSPKELSNFHKINIIRKIWKNGGKVIKEKVVKNVTEEEAFKAEIELIEKYGIKRFGGILVNQTLGGEGPSGYEWTWEQVDSQRERMKQVGDDRKQQRLNNGAEAYVKAYSMIVKKMTDNAKKSEIEKKIIAEAYAEVNAFLARHIFHGSNSENEAKIIAEHILKNLDTKIALKYLISDASQMGEIKAKNQAKEIKKVAIALNLFTEEESEKIAYAKAHSYSDRRNTGRFGKAHEKISAIYKSDGGLTEQAINGIVSKTLKNYLSGKEKI
jgi:LEM-3-like GIY-YIG domain